MGRSAYRTNPVMKDLFNTEEQIQTIVRDIHGCAMDIQRSKQQNCFGLIGDGKVLLTDISTLLQMNIHLSNFKYYNGAVINIFPTSQPNLTIPTATGPGGTVNIRSTIYRGVSIFKITDPVKHLPRPLHFIFRLMQVLDRYDTN